MKSESARKRKALKKKAEECARNRESLCAKLAFKPAWSEEERGKKEKEETQERRGGRMKKIFLKKDASKKNQNPTFVFFL